MASVVPPIPPGGSRNTASPFNVRITNKMKIYPTNFPPTAISFPNHKAKQDKPPSLSAVPTLQVGQAVTHIDSNVTRVPEMITKVMICTVSGDTMYLIEGTPNRTHQDKIHSFLEPSNPNIFSSMAPFGLSIITRPPKTLQQLLTLVPTAIPL